MVNAFLELELKIHPHYFDGRIKKYTHCTYTYNEAFYVLLGWFVFYTSLFLFEGVKRSRVVKYLPWSWTFSDMIKVKILLNVKVKC